MNQLFEVNCLYDCDSGFKMWATFNKINKLSLYFTALFMQSPDGGI